MLTALSSVGTSICAPSAASQGASGISISRSWPSLPTEGRNSGCGSRTMCRYKSPGGPPFAPAPPLPASRRRCPSVAPRGIRARIARPLRRSSRSAPRLLEAEAHRHFVILAGELHAAAGTAAAHAGTAEDAHRLEQVGQVDVAQVVAHSSCPAAAEAVEPVGRRAEVLARAVAAQAVVRGALFLVAQRLVRLGDLLELLLGVRFLGDVRVVLARQAAVGLLDLLVGRAAFEAEDLVIVLVLHAPLHGGGTKRIQTPQAGQRLRSGSDIRRTKGMSALH